MTLPLPLSLPTLPAGVVAIGAASTRAEEGGRSRRWADVAIYRTADGRYFARNVGRSIEPGEDDRVTDYPIVATAREVLESMLSHPNRRGQTLRVVEADALNDAAENDPVFGEQLGDAADVEEIPPIGGATFTIIRYKDRDLRFSGSLLGEVDSRRVGVPSDRERRVWQDLRVYRTLAGLYVIERIGRSDHADHNELYSGAVAATGAEVVAKLATEGGLTRTALALIEQIRERDQRFEAETTEALAAAPRHFTLARDNGRPLTFTGIQIADARGLDGGAYQRAIVSRTKSGQYVLAWVRAGADGAETSRADFQTPADLAAIAARAQPDSPVRRAIARAGDVDRAIERAILDVGIFPTSEAAT